MVDDDRVENLDVAADVRTVGLWVSASTAGSMCW